MSRGSSLSCNFVPTAWRQVRLQGPSRSSCPGLPCYCSRTSCSELFTKETASKRIEFITILAGTPPPLNAVFKHCKHIFSATASGSSDNSCISSVICAQSVLLKASNRSHGVGQVQLYQPSSHRFVNVGPARCSTNKGPTIVGSISQPYAAGSAL